MKKFRIETPEDGFDLAAWVRQVSSAEPVAEETPPSPPSANNTVPKRPRRSTPLIEVALVPRWKWSKAHRALVASGEPHESTAEDAVVRVRTTFKGWKALQPYALEGCVDPQP